MLSVFTASHDTRYLNAAYQGLASQSYADWEWVILLNGKAKFWEPPSADTRVSTHLAPSSVRGVGALKRLACELTKGDILVELDHDDVLMPDCLASLAECFLDHPAISLAYSDFAQIGPDGSPDPNEFDATSGWVYTREEHDGREFYRCHAMAATPHNLGYIWYAPNHVRAFRRTSYDAAGGYDASLTILDDQDLMIRLFEVGDFHHVEQLLYLQRVHGQRTQARPAINANIQVTTVAMYEQNIRKLALTWSQRQGLRALRLIPYGWFGSPSEDGFEDVEIDPENITIEVADETVGVVLATDVLQRVFRRDLLLNEIYRVLPHAGLLLSTTPSTDGRGAFQDPSAIAYYNENSFIYLTQVALRATIPMLQARLQVSHLRTHFPTEIHEQMKISYVEANLIAIKDGPRQGGPLLC